MFLIFASYALALWYGAERAYADSIEYCETKALSASLCLADPRNYTLAAANGTSLLNFCANLPQRHVRQRHICRRRANAGADRLHRQRHVQGGSCSTATTAARCSRCCSP
jgi:hypothetical protein